MCSVPEEAACQALLVLDVRSREGRGRDKVEAWNLEQLDLSTFPVGFHV